MIRQLLEGLLALSLLVPNGTGHKVQEETPKDDLYCTVNTHIMWWFNDEEYNTYEFKTEEEYMNWTRANDWHHIYYDYEVTFYHDNAKAALTNAVNYRIYTNSHSFDIVDQWGNIQSTISPRQGILTNLYIFNGNISSDYRYNLSGYGSLYLVNCVLDGQNKNYSDNIFHIDNGGYLVLDNSVIKNFNLNNDAELFNFNYNGDYYEQYALVRGQNNARVENIHSNGKGITHMDCYNAELEGVTFTNCSSDKDGGVVYVTWGIVDGCTFKNNYSDGDGGAIYIDDDYGQIKNSKFYNNSCDDDGGAIYVNVDDGWIHDCYFEGNNSGVDGGAICIDGDETVVDNCQFVRNTADDDGGAVYVCVGIDDVEIRNCTFDGNHADDACDNVDGRSDTRVYNTGSTIANTSTPWIIVEIATVLVAALIILIILKKRPKQEKK